MQSNRNSKDIYVYIYNAKVVNRKDYMVKVERFERNLNVRQIWAKWHSRFRRVGFWILCCSIFDFRLFGCYARISIADVIKKKEKETIKQHVRIACGGAGGASINLSTIWFACDMRSDMVFGWFCGLFSFGFGIQQEAGVKRSACTALTP